jgi:hypothetical protein
VENRHVKSDIFSQDRSRVQTAINVNNNTTDSEGRSICFVSITLNKLAIHLTLLLLHPTDGTQKEAVAGREPQKN